MMEQTKRYPDALQPTHTWGLKWRAQDMVMLYNMTRVEAEQLEHWNPDLVAVQIEVKRLKPRNVYDRPAQHAADLEREQRHAAKHKD
jgi:hypothetical protein